MKIHKRYIEWRDGVFLAKCGIDVTPKESSRFWFRVTCKNCLRSKKR